MLHSEPVDVEKKALSQELLGFELNRNLSYHDVEKQ